MVVVFKPTVDVLGGAKSVVLPDVDDDSHRPHVQGAVVAFVPQHLGGQIGWSADHRAAERLLADDASEPKVTQLHLWKGAGKK